MNLNFGDNDREKVGVRMGLDLIRGIIDSLGDDIDAKRGAWISFAAGFIDALAPAATIAKGAEYADALRGIADLGRSLVPGFDPKEEDLQ